MVVVLGLLDTVQTGQNPFQLMENITKYVGIPSFGFLLKLMDGMKEVVRFVKVLVYKAFEGVVIAPRKLKSKWIIGPLVFIPTNVNKEETVVRLGFWQVSDCCFWIVIYPEVIRQTPVKSFQTELSSIAITFISQSIRTPFEP